MIKNICFDADGVLVNPAFQFSRHLHEVYGVAPQTTMSFFQGIFNNCLTGEKQMSDELPPYLESWGWHKGVDEFIQTWLEQDNAIDEKMVRVVKQLRKAGKPCHLITNQEYNRAAYMRNQMGFEALFDTCFISCEMGCQKPDAAYYRHIENTLNVSPEEILFWDDSEGHVQAARQRGWQAEVYCGFDEFAAVMTDQYGLNWRK